MADEDQIAVTIVDESGTDPVVEGAPEDPVADLKAQLDTITANAEAEKAARLEADRRAAEAARRAQDAVREAQNARAETATTQLDAVATGLQSAQAEASAAESEYTQAMEKGDFAAAAKAQRRMAASEAQIIRLSEAKSDLEARRTAQPDPAERPRDADSGRFVSKDDRFEGWLQNFTAPTANWLRQHRDLAEDQSKLNQLTRLHQKATLVEDLEPDTPAYFEFIERNLGLRKDAPVTTPDVKTNGAAAPRARAASAPVAPVNGGGGATTVGASTGSEVVLTRGEARAATDGTHVWNYDDPSGNKKFKKGDPIGIQEFARRKQAMLKAGAYDKSYVEN